MKVSILTYCSIIFWTASLTSPAHLQMAGRCSGEIMLKARRGEQLWLNALPAPYRTLYGRVTWGNPLSTASFFIRGKTVEHRNYRSGETYYPYNVLTDFWKTGILVISGRRCKGKCLWPGRISNPLIFRQI